MSKRSIRHGGIVCCDMQTVVDEPNNYYTKDRCPTTYTTYSESRLARGQAEAHGKWKRVQVKRVKWPGVPPGSPRMKVDLCPVHGEPQWVKTDAELAQEQVDAKIARAADKVKREQERAEAKAARKAEKARVKAEAPRKPRKRKVKADSTVEAQA